MENVQQGRVEGQVKMPPTRKGPQKLQTPGATAITPAPKLSLFEMRQKREELFQQFFEGIIDQVTFTEEQNLAIRKVLEEKTEEAIQRRDDLVDLFRCVEDEIEHIKKVEETAYARRKQLESFLGCGRESIRLQMEFIGVKRIEGRIHRLSLREGFDKVEVTDIALLPPQFINYEPKADKAEISKALHAGEVVPGAELIPAKKSLVIS